MPRDAHVLHATFSPLGGAGAVAVRLAAAQRRLGWQADLATLVESAFPMWAAKHPAVAAAALMDFYVVRRNPQSAFFSLYRKQHHARIAREISDYPFVLHLHWLPGMISPATLLNEPGTDRQIFWSVQDLWPLTGGCHYANGCDGFERDCAACPQVRRIFQPRVMKALQARREALSRRRQLVLVTPSEWTRRMIRSSAAMRHLRVEVIPNPIDTRLFSPCEKIALRSKWKVPADAFVIGLGAADLRDERKQIQRTLQILIPWISSSPADRRPQILLFGGGLSKGSLQMPPGIRLLGATPDAATLGEWYGLMDVYVTLSRFETFGNTIAEAAACGTPTICSTGSGMAEVVLPGQTGLHLNTPDQLSGALTAFRNDPAQCARMGLQAREHAVRTFDDDVIARRFLSLYEESTRAP